MQGQGSQGTQPQGGTSQQSGAKRPEEPLADVMYDLLTVLQSKSEGLWAYDEYIYDARQAGENEIAQRLERWRDEDKRLTEEVKNFFAQQVQRRWMNQQAPSGRAAS